MIINYGPCIVVLQQASTDMCILTVLTYPENADVELMATGYSQVGNMIRVPLGTQVKCEVYAEGYGSFGGIILVRQSSQTQTVTLEPGVLCTINTTPTDAKLSFIIDGYTFELDETNKLYVPINHEFTYVVSKEGYATRKGTLSISEDTVIDVELNEGIPVEPEDYEYTLDDDSNMTITSYIGNNTDTTVP